MARLFLAFGAFFALSSLLPDSVVARESLTADLDPLITLPGAYSLGPDDLEELFPQGKWNRNPYFKWLDQKRTRAIFQRKDMPNLEVQLSFLGGQVAAEELVIDFREGKYLGVTVSLFNRGDGGAISSDEFELRFRSMGRHLGEQLAVRPTRRQAKPTQGLLTEGFIWISARGKAVLEHNPEAPGNTEFLRMRLAQRDAKGAYEAATKARAGATVKLSDLPRQVNRSRNGDVYIRGIPMVDQGAKGYCVVATAQRVFEYYGIPADMHQLAQIAESSPEEGTSPLLINEQLGKIDHRFKTRFTCLAVSHRNGLVELEDNRHVGDRVPEDEFHDLIRKSIDDGIPVLWGLELGRFPEEPPIAPQTSGGHMRMIIGYNETSNRIIFSDSWGAGHEFKTMDANDAYRATGGIFTLKPTTR